MSRTGQHVRSGTPKPEPSVVRVKKLPGQRGSSKKPKAWNPSQLFPGKPKKAVVTESWWVGLTHEELNAEALRRHPGSQQSRDNMPTAHAKGALRGL